MLALALVLALPATDLAPLSLADALAMLDGANPDLAAATARLQQVEADAHKARSAVLPKLAAFASYVHNSDDARLSFADTLGALVGASPVPVRLPRDVVMQPSDQLSASLALRVPLFSGSSHWEWSAAAENALAAGKQREAVRRVLRLALVRTAYAASAAQAVEDVAQRAADTSRVHLESTRRSVAAGLDVELSALRAETELVARQADVASAQAQRRTAERALGTLLGCDGPVRIDLPAPNQPSGSLDDALLARPELQAARAHIDAAKALHTAALLRYAPTLAASAQGFTSDVPYVTGKKSGWRVGVELSWQLFDGGFREAALDGADAVRASAEAELTGGELMVKRDVREAEDEVQVAREQLRLASQASQVASRAAVSAQRGFDGGQLRELEVTDALSRAYDAEVREVLARARLGSALAQLASTLGQL